MGRKLPRPLGGPRGSTCQRCALTLSAKLGLYQAKSLHHRGQGARLMAAAIPNETILLEVVRSAMDREPQAVERLFCHLLPRVRNLVRYLVRGDQEVDDLSQDALVAILQGLATYRSEGPFSSWADRVVARTVFACLKRRRRTPRPGGQVDAGQMVGELAAPAGRDSDYAARRHLAMLLDHLPSDQRVTLTLKHVLGLSVREIAEECSVPPETVRSRLRLAKNRLRDLLQGDGEITGVSLAPRMVDDHA